MCPFGSGQSLATDRSEAIGDQSLGRWPPDCISRYVVHAGQPCTTSPLSPKTRANCWVTCVPQFRQRAPAVDDSMGVQLCCVDFMSVMEWIQFWHRGDGILRVQRGPVRQPHWPNARIATCRRRRSDRSRARTSRDVGSLLQRRRVTVRASLRCRPSDANKGVRLFIGPVVLPRR